jgi:hypothetical protein
MQLIIYIFNENFHYNNNITIYHNVWSSFEMIDFVIVLLMRWSQMQIHQPII